MEETKELVPVTGAEVVTVTQDAALAAMIEADAGDGLEGVTAADVAIPILKLLQKGSPQCEEGNAAFMPEAKPGHVLNTVTRELIDIRGDRFAVIIPVLYEKKIAEWRPNQGGLIAKHLMLQATLDAATRVETPDGGIKLVNAAGNTLEETAYFNVLLLTASGSVHWGLLALAGSKLGASRNLMNLVMAKKTASGKLKPIYAHAYRVSSFLDESKRTKKTFQNFRFQDQGPITDSAVYVAAKAYREAVIAGKVKAVDESPAADSVNGEDIPF